LSKEDVEVDENSLKDELTSLFDCKPEGKILFYRYSKKWHDFLYSLHKEDRLILLKMVLEICCYNECAINAINVQDSQSNIDHLFFLLAIILQQKHIDKLNVGGTKKKKDMTLLEFMQVKELF